MEIAFHGLQPRFIQLRMHSWRWIFLVESPLTGR